MGELTQDVKYLSGFESSWISKYIDNGNVQERLFLFYEFKVDNRAGKCKKVIGLTGDVKDLSHPGYQGLAITMSN